MLEPKVTVKLKSVWLSINTGIHKPCHTSQVTSTLINQLLLKLDHKMGLRQSL